MTWYVKKEDWIAVPPEMHAEEAFGYFAHPLSKGGAYNHLVIETESQVLGVIEKEKLRIILGLYPMVKGQKTVGQVSRFMVEHTDILKFSWDMSADDVSEAIYKESNREIFYRAHAVFILDIKGEIIGFATEHTIATHRKK